MQSAMNAGAGRIFLGIAVLAIMGTVVSSVSLYHHYGKDKTTYCDFGENFNCDIVNRSPYSTVFGIPVALIGMVGYLSLLALATFYREKAETPGMLLVGATLGLGFALYLSYIEAFVLGTWCVLCLSSLAAILLITVLSSVLFARSLRGV
ncbi:MAG TPA: vitamin K epoxide reductase family protein [Terriglobales bacterium]|nr:vitamin K epoxide reductase family protein [Terriglobales bacterium]